MLPRRASRHGVLDSYLGLHGPDMVSGQSGLVGRELQTAGEGRLQQHKACRSGLCAVVQISNAHV